MMKNRIIYSFMAVGSLALLASCSENSWNRDLDGFEIPDQFTDKTTASCILTPADYKTIAGEARNKAIAEADGETALLAAIGTNGYFPTAAAAQKYIPAFLRDSTGVYYTLNDGSQIDVTYNLETAIPEIVKKINAGVDTYTVTEEDYQSIWESDENYIEAFAPMKPASASLASLLKKNFPNATAGSYAVVNYNVTDVNPVFGNVGGETTVFEPTSVLTSSLAKDDEITVKGYVTAIDARGYVVSDNAGSILAYQAKDFDVASVALGQEITISGTVGAYGTGLQFDVTACEVTLGEVTGYTYPTPTTYTGAMMDEAVKRSGNFLLEYVKFDCKVSVSGNYINFIVDGAEASQGSGYQVPQFIKDQLVDGENVTIYGYFASVSSGKYFNVVITAVAKAGEKPAKTPAYAPATEVNSSAAVALYYFDGSKWSVPSNTTILQPADYKAMNQGYGNFSGTDAYYYLPLFLSNEYPFALEDDVMTVVYRYYNGSSTNFMATQYTLTDGTWVRNEGQTVDKFARKNGFWVYNPSVEITLPYARNTSPSYDYYMDCVYWVLDNVVKPTNPDATLTTATPYIDYRGNAEFYSGASAYYGNVDIRANTAKSNAPTGAYDGMTDDEIVLLIKKRFSTQTLPYALKMQNPGAKPVDGMQVTYTVNFTIYDGAASVQTIVYEVVGPGEFKYLESTWAEGQDADWK